MGFKEISIAGMDYHRTLAILKRCQTAYDNRLPPEYWEAELYETPEEPEYRTEDERRFR